MNIFEGIELDDSVKEALQQKIDEGFVNRNEFDAVLSNKEKLLGEKKAEAEKRRLAEEEAANAALEAAKGKGDVESLSKSYEEKINALQNQINDFNMQAKQQTVGNIAKAFVEQNVVDDPLIRQAMTAELSKRLDMRDGKAVVLDNEGNLTALSTDDLFSEFKSASVYKPHLVASKASGGSATGGNSSGNAGGNLAGKTLADCKTKEERLEVLNARIAGN